MSYSLPNRQKYSFGPVAALTSDETYAMCGPKGKKGRLYDYGFEGVTTVFAGDTTKPTISVGVIGTLGAYGAIFAVGAIADNTAKSVRSTYDPVIDKTSFEALVLPGTIPADTALVLSVVGATGGSAGGVGKPFCIIDWED